MEFYSELKDRFSHLVRENNIDTDAILIKTRAMTVEEAIGITERKDFPIKTGNDVMIEADYLGEKGQAFTDAPVAFKGNLDDVCRLDIQSNPYDRGIFIAALNAVMKKLGLIECSVHCRNEGPEKCSFDALDYLVATYGKDIRIGQIGYQPAMFERLSAVYEMRICDLDPQNVGKVKNGVTVESGSDETRDSICTWADLVLCTGSTVCNGSIVGFLPYREKTLFYGTTLAGTAALMNLKRLCFADKYSLL